MLAAGGLQAVWYAYVCRTVRGAFIAVQILQSLVTCGIITKQDYDQFMNGVDIVISDMNADFKELPGGGFHEKMGISDREHMILPHSAEPVATVVIFKN